MGGYFPLSAACRIAPLALAALLLVAPDPRSYAQNDGYPPGGIPGGYRNSARSADDSASLLVRIDRLENRVRIMTGQIEQLQFQMRQMQKKLEAFQKDVDFRFTDQPDSSRSRRPERRGDIQPQRRETADAETGHRSPPDTRDRSDRSATNDGRGRDVFNPADNPNAPGAPVQLGSPRNVPSAPLTRGPLSRSEPDRGLPGPDSPMILSRPLTGEDANATRNASTNSGTPPKEATPREVYRTAITDLRDRKYEAAELGFKDFMKRFPKSSLTPSVLYNLGVTYASRSRHREAAEQFLKVSTDYRKSSRAPESLYRLGLSLERLGAREQACASYAEVERRYPRSPGSLRVRVERQMKTAKC